MLSAEQLFDIARQKSAEGRTRLADAVTDLFLDEGDLTDVERALMFDILHNLVRDMEAPIRKKLAERLSELDEAPADLVETLANDEIDIAYPLLLKSRLLEDEALIEIIHHRTLEHRLAIAMRYEVSEKVSDALVESGEESVIQKLLENGNAILSRQAMDFLVEESRRVNSFQDPLVRRQDLPRDLAARMCLWVSAALRKHILDNFDIAEDELDPLIEAAGRDQTRELSEAARKAANPKAPLLDSLQAEDRLDVELIISLIEDGMVDLALSAFSRLTKIPDRLCRRIVFEPGGEGLAIACRAIGASPAAFEKLFMTSRKARSIPPKVLKREHRKATELYEHLVQKECGLVLRRWQLGSDYLFAIRELKERMDAADQV